MARAAARKNCLDASALVKLVLPEPRSEKLQTYLARESGWYTTPFCFYEALNVIKRKHLEESRMLKAKCEAKGCGFIVRVAASQVKNVGPPHCPKHGAMAVAESVYHTATLDLIGEFNGSLEYLPDVDFTDVSRFSETKSLCNKYNFDFSDAFQILSVKSPPHFAGDSQTVLVTDDKKLARAAVLENCKVWHLPDDPPA
jgi:predicted nucleic acid-binding protein